MLKKSQKNIQMLTIVKAINYQKIDLINYH